MRRMFTQSGNKCTSHPLLIASPAAGALGTTGRRFSAMFCSFCTRAIPCMTGNISPNVISRGRIRPYPPPMAEPRYKEGGQSYHTGDSPDARMTEAAAKRGVMLGGASRPLRPADLDEFDLVVGMVRWVYAFLRRALGCMTGRMQNSSRQYLRVRIPTAVLQHGVEFVEGPSWVDSSKCCGRTHT